MHFVFIGSFKKSSELSFFVLNFKRTILSVERAAGFWAFRAFVYPLSTSNQKQPTGKPHSDHIFIHHFFQFQLSISPLNMIRGGRTYVSSPPAFSNDAKRLLVCSGNAVSIFSTATGLPVSFLFPLCCFYYYYNYTPHNFCSLFSYLFIYFLIVDNISKWSHGARDDSDCGSGYESSE